jgi:hypothetical protein
MAIANALDGMDRASAARLAGMDRQTLRDWVHRYNGKRPVWTVIRQQGCAAEAGRPK